MPAHQLVIAPAAKLDLKSIYQYGLRQWGKPKSDQYLTSIKNQFWALTDQPLIGVERPELLAGIRSLPIQSHTLYYRVATRRIDIIRILHNRQDPQRHLK